MVTLDLFPYHIQVCLVHASVREEILCDFCVPKLGLNGPKPGPHAPHIFIDLATGFELKDLCRSFSRLEDTQ